MEKKVSEERARILQEKQKQGELRKDSDTSIVIEDQQLSPAPSCSSSEGGTVDKASSAKEGTCKLCACVTKLYKLVSSLSVVRKEVPFRVKRNFDILRGRYGSTFIRVFNLIKTCNLEEMKV